MRAAEPDEQDQDQAADGAEASPDSSTASSAGTDFFENEGPEFEGEQRPDEERSAFTLRPGDQELLDLEWDPRVIRSLLEASGQGIHSLAGKGDEDWIFLERELRAIAPPLARILSRYPTTAAAAAAGDEIAVLIGLGGYTARSIKERKAALEALDLNTMTASQGMGIPSTPPEHEEALIG